MMCVLSGVLLAVLLTQTSSSLSSAGAPPASRCPPRWLLFGQRCFAFFPVWSSWSSAQWMCSQTGSSLAALHTAQETQFVRQLASSDVPVWLDGHQEHQNGSWFWSDDSPVRIGDWTNQRQGTTREGGACMAMTPKSGELHSAPCGELRFYICATTRSFVVSSSNRKPAEPVSVSGVVPGVSLFDVVWGFSAPVVEDIVRSSSLVAALRSGQLTQRCYASFSQQEALYLLSVSSTLQALISGLQEADDMRSLLLDTLKHYSSRNQSLLASSPPPPWLRSSLQSFHSVVLEDPVFWLVALSARACLRHFLSGAEVKAGGVHRDWSEDTLTEVAWTRRYRKVLEDHQDHIDVFKAVNVFRDHMMNQKSFYTAVVCDEDDDRR